MRLRPRPSEMVLMSMPKRGKVIHLGHKENGIYRVLCQAGRTGLIENYIIPKVVHRGKVNCNYCKKRLKVIQNMIEKLGVEWVCDGIWVPIEKRVFKSVPKVLIQK